MHVSAEALEAWLRDDLTKTEAILSAEITRHPLSRHHALANRSILRARLKQWEKADDDAQKVCSHQLSIIRSFQWSTSL